MRFLSFWPKTFANARGPFELFDVSSDFTREDGGMYWLLSNFGLPPDSQGKAPRIADAVAVAGLQAARENHRRAVVLVLGPDPLDTSDYDPATVRAYLDSIRVPLFVWSFYDLGSPMAQAWGGAEDISTLAKLEDAAERLRAELDSQRIVWVDGRHLPQAIRLSSAAGVELVGAGR